MCHLRSGIECHACAFSLIILCVTFSPAHIQIHPITMYILSLAPQLCSVFAPIPILYSFSLELIAYLLFFAYALSFHIVLCLRLFVLTYHARKLNSFPPCGVNERSSRCASLPKFFVFLCPCSNSCPEVCPYFLTTRLAE